MATIDYETMSKTQRLAAFFIIVGPELAPELMKQLRDQEIEDVAREMAAMNVVDFKLQEKIMDEFCELIGEGMSASLGGMSFVQRHWKPHADHKPLPIFCSRPCPPATPSMPFASSARWTPGRYLI